LLIILPFFYASISFFSKRTKRFSHNMMEKASHVSKNLHESISGVDLIKAFATEERETNKLSKTLRESVQTSIEQNSITAFSQQVIGMIASIGTVFVLWYGSREIIFERLTIGSFVAFQNVTFSYHPDKPVLRDFSF